MSQSSELSPSQEAEFPESQSPSEVPVAQSLSSPAASPPPSYVKLAMRNMVRKGGKSLFHFGLTTLGLLGLLLGLAYLTR